METPVFHRSCKNKGDPETFDVFGSPRFVFYIFTDWLAAIASKADSACP